jgi:LPXTG-motif cell wall-anchored protein
MPALLLAIVMMLSLTPLSAWASGEPELVLDTENVEVEKGKSEIVSVNVVKPGDSVYDVEFDTMLTVSDPEIFDASAVDTADGSTVTVTGIAPGTSTLKLVVNYVWGAVTGTLEKLVNVNVKLSPSEEAIEEVVKAFEEVDSLQTMQDKRSTEYQPADPGKFGSAVRKSMAAAYSDYLFGSDGDSGMFRKREDALALFDALDYQGQQEVRSRLADTDDLDKLDTQLYTRYMTEHIEDYKLVRPENDGDVYNYQLVEREIALKNDRIIYTLYELSPYVLQYSVPGAGKAHNTPGIYMLANTNEVSGTWTPSFPHSMTASDYVLTYCADSGQNTDNVHYKRINLEDASYFDEDNAQRLRAVLERSYPFVPLEQTVDMLAAKTGLEDINRAEVIAAVQGAVWEYVNGMTETELYGILDPNSSDAYMYSLHDYRNELWDWWLDCTQYSGSIARGWCGSDDPAVIADRDGNTRYERLARLLSAMLEIGEQYKTEAEDDGDHVVITKAEIVGATAVPGSEEYQMDIDVQLNGRLASGTITVINETTQSTQVIEAEKGKTEYTLRVNAAIDDNVKVLVEGMQDLKNGAYFYEPVGGRRASQCMVGMAMGMTPVSAESEVVKLDKTFVKTAVTVDKTWQDADNQDGIRPESITVHLFANGTEVQSTEVRANAEGEWGFTFAGLQKYDGQGEEIVYTVSEDPVTGYTSTVDGWSLINTHTPEVVRIDGVKNWNDADNYDGLRPANITIRLLADGVEVRSIVVLPDVNGEWKFTFSDMPRYNNGKEIVYSVTEDSVDSYTTEITENDGWVVTNTHVPTPPSTPETPNEPDVPQVRTDVPTVPAAPPAPPSEEPEVPTEPTPNAPTDSEPEPTPTVVPETPASVVPVPVDEPAVPEIPDTPVTPPVPDTPVTPPVPDTPVTPPVPDTPVTPPVPVTPDYPEEPPVEVPDEPTPLTEEPPTEPEIPAQPPEETPETPVEIPEEEVPLTEVPEEPEETEEIPDEDVPLAELPEETEEIPDEEVPLADVSPATGDNSHTLLWAGVSIVSLGGALLLLRKKKEN